jgi:hypothetical protein
MRAVSKPFTDVAGPTVMPGILNTPLKNAFRSPFDKLRVSGKPCGPTLLPFMLSLSKYERHLLQQAVKPAFSGSRMDFLSEVAGMPLLAHLHAARVRIRW